MLIVPGFSGCTFFRLERGKENLGIFFYYNPFHNHYLNGYVVHLGSAKPGTWYDRSRKGLRKGLLEVGDPKSVVFTGWEFGF